MTKPTPLDFEHPSNSSPSVETENVTKPRLLDQVRSCIRRMHYSIRTEQTYISWIKRYIYFHDKRHPNELDENHITEFLNFLAVQRRVASSTQNQAMCALVFLYRHVLKKDLAQFENMVFAKRPSKLPVVFTREEVRNMLLQLEGVTWIMGQLLYNNDLHSCPQQRW